MDVALIIRVAGISLIIAACHHILSRAGKEDMAMLVSLTGSVIVLAMLAEKIGVLFNTIKTIFGL